MPPARGKHPVPSRSAGGDRDLASVGALVADRARCQMLVALGDGRSLPAGRLAAAAEVSASTASSHLHKLVAGGLLVVENAGRRRNYRLADPEVAVLIEALERLAPTLPIRSLGQSQQARAWRQARVCYDHMAGALGVELMRSLLEQSHLGPVHEAAGAADPDQVRYSVTAAGATFLEALGVAIPSGRQPVRHHMDSTEDGSHISGVLGRALLAGFVDLGWLQRHNRRLHITPPGRQGFGQQFGISLDD